MFGFWVGLLGFIGVGLVVWVASRRADDSNFMSARESDEECCQALREKGLSESSIKDAARNSGIEYYDDPRG